MRGTPFLTPEPGGDEENNSLVENINRRKRTGTSRAKSRSTVSREAYKDMQRGWPKKKKKKKKSKQRKHTAK